MGARPAFDDCNTLTVFERAFARAAGARRIEGNRVRLLRDAVENYPAWLEAIAAAERYIYFESYILRDDKSGRQFADALTAKARAGVPVRLLYDWMGALGKTPERFWAALRRAGVEVRCFNPLRLSSPFGWVHRDHRKSLVVDGSVGFITGLCVGDDWVGDPARGIEPWRDTGIGVYGPAVAEIERAFAHVWSVAGPPLPAGERRASADPPDPDGMALRIVATEPGVTGLQRLDELVAAAARETLWLTDAYFAGISSYVQALRAAALDGVDVRLLVPGSLSAHEAEHHPGAAAGPYVVLSTTDTGHGMPPESMAHIFEPFFTTKEIGKGTGLGLSTVHGVVQQSGGFVTVESAVGAGTTFRVFLPEWTGDAEPVGEVPPESLAATGRATILAVEDEAAVRVIVRRVLQQHGYRVLEAANGREALDLLARGGASVDLVLTDYVMPELGGRALVERLRALGHAPAILYMSGYADDAVLRSGDLPAGMGFVQKPFTGEQLLAHVRQLLHAQGSRGDRSSRGDPMPEV